VELRPFLSKILYYSFLSDNWTDEPEDMEEIFECIRKEYRDLQKEYFSLNQDS